MRLNEQEEDLFKELENIEFDFTIDDEIEKLDKKDKEKLLKDININEENQNEINSNNNIKNE
ncbi:MAG: hypothetical protein HZB41_02520 [Ignavibacteriae bacterium]|nr:hypothetical protein [Ignavibacteriota bacterium]